MTQLKCSCTVKRQFEATSVTGSHGRRGEGRSTGLNIHPTATKINALMFPFRVNLIDWNALAPYRPRTDRFLSPTGAKETRTDIISNWNDPTVTLTFIFCPRQKEHCHLSAY